MFKRPNWQEMSAYKKSKSMDLHGGMAWEFMRRNPEYQHDAALYRAEILQTFTRPIPGYLKWLKDNHTSDCFESQRNFFSTADPKAYVKWMFFAREKWLINFMLVPDDDWSQHNILFPTWEDSQSFERTEFSRPKGPRVLIPVDLSEPLDLVLKRAAFRIRALRKSGIEEGTVKPQKKRVAAKGIYITQLRILDAVAAGIAIKEIGETLAPADANPPDVRGRDKRFEKAKKAAEKMQAGGFRVLMCKEI